MQVHAASSSLGTAGRLGFNRVQGVSRRAATQIASAPDQEASETGAERDDAQAAPAATKPAKTAGVLRLLDAGHFNAIAELRHRIKYAEQLSTQSQAAAADAAPQQVTDLANSINSQIDALVAPLNLSGDTQDAVTALRSDFNTALQTALHDHVSDGSVDASGLASALQTAFDEFVTQLQQVIWTALVPAPSSDLPGH